MDKFLTRTSSNPNLSAKRPGDDRLHEWRIPKRPFKTSQDQGKDNFLTFANRFGNLPTDADANSAQDSCSKSFRDATTSVKKSAHIPPIIMEVKQDWTHQTIKDLISLYTKQFHLQYRGSNKVAIISYSADAHQAIKNGLRKESASYLTYTRKDEKTPKVVIRGLPAYVEDELAGELATLGFQGAKITKLKSKQSENAPCPPFLIQLPAGTDINKFRQIKYILSCVVTMSKYKHNSTSGTQCFRCQGFGHSSKNCNMPSRCVKCVESHPIGECLKKDRIEPARCVNCSENHPANYRQCSVRLSYLQRIQHKREELKLKPTLLRNTKPVENSRLWAEVAAEKQHQPSLRVEYSAQHIPRMESTAQPQQDPATEEMLRILRTIKTLKNEFIASTSMLDKVMLILSHLGQYV